MKQLLVLRQDFILEGTFKAKEKRTEGGYEYDWVDNKKDKAHGKNIIDHVVLFVPQVDNNGYETSIHQKVYLGKEDIIEIAKRIEEIESVELTGVPGDNLPF